MGKLTSWLGDAAKAAAAKVGEVAAEAYQDLRPTLAAGAQDAQRLFTTMDAQGTNLAGIASVPGQPGVLTQMEANEAITHEALAEPSWGERNDPNRVQAAEAGGQQDLEREQPQLEAAE